MTSPEWDVIVIGAGPAGALAAHQLARQQLRVLLVDKRSFPRWKVCGSCLNGVALGALAQAGLPDLVEELGGVPLVRLRLGLQRHQMELERPLGRSLSRGCLDLALCEAAVAAGTVLRMDTEAMVAGPCPGGRQVRLRSGGGPATTNARVVLVATGLGSPGLNPAIPIRSQVQAHSRIGAGCRVEAQASGYAPGTIHMAIGRHGYVGLVRTEAGDLNLAAAFERGHLIETGGAALAAAGVLSEAGFEPVPEAAAAAWLATPALTGRRWPPASERLLLLGDAAGYVEPFTGEGMGWALLAALAVVPLVLQGQGQWSQELERQWVRRYGQLIGSRQRLCHALAFALRRPGLSRWLLGAVERWPFLATPLLHPVAGTSLNPPLPEPCP